MRKSGRAGDELRDISIKPHFIKNAEGSCLISCGDTRVVCTATIEERVPPFLRNSGTGWITAEYGMLPRSTNTRMRREAKVSQSGRTQEIQRLIGRSLRAAVDFKTLGERQIIIDCDVIHADGGTRCASIMGGWVALRLALNYLLAEKKIKQDPMLDHVVATSCGICEGEMLLDLDYLEDSAASTDANFVMTGQGHLIEIQSSAEEIAFSRVDFNAMLDMACEKIGVLIDIQKIATK